MRTIHSTDSTELGSGLYARRLGLNSSTKGKLTMASGIAHGILICAAN